MWTAFAPSRRRALAGLSGLAAAASARRLMAAETAPSAELLRELAPTGRLRAAINLGNTVLAQRDRASGELKGVSVELARELARRTGLPLDLVVFDAAAKVFAALDAGAWDVAFLANEPERAARVAFTAPYVYIESTYLVWADGPFHAVAELDRDGVRIAAGQGSAYDLFLTRALRRAALVRAPTSPEAVALFGAQHLEAAAGIRQFLIEAASERADVRVLPDSYSRVEQAVGLPRGRPRASRYVGEFLEAMKANGFVRRALDASGQTGAVVARP